MNKDAKYSLGIMREELKSEFICPEIKYAFKASIKALEKQIPKEPTKQAYIETQFDDGNDDGFQYFCPICGHIVGGYSNGFEDWIYQEKYCNECGQALRWED